MKDFIVYLNSKVREEPRIKKKELSVKELRSRPGSSELSNELHIVVDGMLRFAGDYSSYNLFSFDALYHPRISFLVKERKPVRAEFTLWHVKDNPFMVAFNIPRKVARIAIALMSMALYDELFAIIPIRLDSIDFIRLWENIKKRSGRLTILHLKKRQGKIVLTGRDLEKEYPNIDFDEELRNAPKIHSLGFILYPPAVERTLSFRITEWGGGQLYSPPDPLDHEILSLLNLFRQTFFS